MGVRHGTLDTSFARKHVHWKISSRIELCQGPRLDGAAHACRGAWLTGVCDRGVVANRIFCHADYGLARGFVHYEDLPVSPYEVLRSSKIGSRLLKRLDAVRFALNREAGKELASFPCLPR